MTSSAKQDKTLVGSAQKVKLQSFLLRAKILHQKFKKQKTIKPIMLPPCSRNLEFHTRRLNYVANLHSEANQLMMLLDSPLLHGWTANGDPEWTDQCFPDDVCDLLLLLCLDDEVDFDEYSEEDISDDDDDGEEEELWWRIET